MPEQAQKSDHQLYLSTELATWRRKREPQHRHTDWRRHPVGRSQQSRAIGDYTSWSRTNRENRTWWATSLRHGTDPDTCSQRVRASDTHSKPPRHSCRTYHLADPTNDAGIQTGVPNCPNSHLLEMASSTAQNLSLRMRDWLSARRRNPSFRLSTWAQTSHQNSEVKAPQLCK